MRQQIRELALGLFLLVLGAAVLLASPLAVGERPGNWEIVAGGLSVLLGAWLVSPDAVGKRLNRAVRAIPFFHDHGDDDG